jgi:competence protein ComEA
MTASGLRWILAGAVAAAGSLALVVAVLRSGGSPPPIELRVPDAPAADGVVKVYITGAVAQPGVYRVQAGDRYADALAAAGGPTEDAEPLAVNLARRVRDEDHIHVPRRGEPGPGGATTGSAALDLNTATAAQLEALPGIGPVRARLIVESRTKDGAFTRPEDLVQRKLIPQTMLEPLRELVLVRP